MRKFFLVGCAYLLLFCMPLQVAAGIPPRLGVVDESTYEEILEVGESNVTETFEEAGEGFLGIFGPGNRNKKRHKEKKKRMGGHKNLSEKIGNNTVFGRQKDSGIGQNVLFLVVPAVAVVGLAFLFAAGTRNKNAESQAEPDPANP